MVRAALALILFAAAAGAAWLIAPRLAALADARYGAQVDATLSAGGYGWARADVDGLQATISGAAPSDAAAAEAVALVAAVSPALTVRNAITAAPKVAPAIISPELEILKGADGLILAGVIADPAVAAALGGDSALLRYGAAPFGPDWRATATVLKDIAATLRHARFTVTQGAIAIDGLATTAGTQDAIAPLIGKLTALGWRLNTRIDAPPKVLEEFRLSVARTPAGVEIICAAASAADAAAIAAAAKTHLAAETDCAVGAGAPDDAWPDAAIAVLAALAPLDAVSADLRGKIVTLTPAPPTTPAAASGAREALATSLPVGYRTLLDDSALLPVRDAPPPFTLTIDWAGGDGPIAIASTQPGGGLAWAEASLAAYARALFPGAGVTFAEKPGAAPPPDWRRVTRTALEALSRLERGEVAIQNGAVTLVGAARRVGDIRAAHDALAAAEGDWRVATRISYDPNLIAQVQPLPPTRCAAAVSGAITAAPISFQPASATLTPASKATVEEIAAILTRCEGARFEIGGHTDAQGSETGNLALSRTRAEAVLSGLIAAKAPPGRLSAKGYGEARPIADNATAIGRALNRRIEFTLIEDPE